MFIRNNLTKKVLSIILTLTMSFTISGSGLPAAKEVIISDKKVVEAGNYIVLPAEELCATNLEEKPEEEIVEEIVEESVVEEQPLYSVNGSMLNEDLQHYLYGQLDSLGISWWYPYAMCQCYQESKFNSSAISKNGLDMGLWQFRITYWASVAASCGLPNANPLNPYEETYVYVRHIKKLIDASGGVPEIVFMNYYNSGNYDLNARYSNQVMQWLSCTVKECQK